MSYNHRALSPGGRRILNQGRASDAALTDPYYQQPRHNSYASPRSSGGVIPISTQTFVNIPPPSSSRPSERYDSYSGRPRRSSLVDTQRGASASTTQLPSRSRPNVIQQSVARPSSPGKASRDKDYYVTPASSQEPRTTATHKKLYSVDDGGAKLVADVNIPLGGGERHHKRRDSVDRGHRVTGLERDRDRRGYNANGSYSRPKDKSIDDDDAYSYTDPASMYRDTEPRWREMRGRRSSMDRGGATSRERPVSLLDPTFGAGIRPGIKEVGPPPSTRGWDKINDIGRTRVGKDEPRQVAQSPTRGRTYAEPGAYGDPRDLYYVPPRTSSTDRRATIHNYDTYDYDDRREPRRAERRHSITRDARADKSVERRGFGILTDRRNESQTRFVGRDGRGSDESFERQSYRDSGYSEPFRRDPAQDPYSSDVKRTEHEKRDREAAPRSSVEEFGRTRDRGFSDTREYSREPRRRDDERGYAGDYDRRERDYDPERERERERSRQPEMPDRERDRHHHRRDTDRDRDRDRDTRKESPRQSGESIPKPGLSQAATGGLAGAAAAFGLSGLLNKVSEKRDKDKEDHQDRDRADRNERDDRRNGDDREHARERKPALSASDEAPLERREDRGRHRDQDRGLGFAFEGSSDPSRNGPSMNTERNQSVDRKPDERKVEWSQERQAQDRGSQRDIDREPSKPTDQPASTAVLDADEDYRRRMEQVQRELGRPADVQQSSDSDPDRERRRREREQRLRERENRNGGPGAGAGSGAGPAVGLALEGGIVEIPPHPARRSLDEQSTLESVTTAQTSNAGTELRRKPSILDMPMNDGGAQIIDNSLSEKRENRVRIVDPPTDEEEKRPRGILKKPTEKFPEDKNAVREGVAPLKDATKKGIPPGARWTKIDRRLVNPEALEQSHERFEERLDCVIVLRVLTKEEIQKLADKTREIRDRRYDEERDEKASHRSRRNRDRHERGEYEFSDSEDEFKEKTPKMLEAPSSSTAAGASNTADFVRENRDRRHEREREADPAYMSGGLGRRDEAQVRY